MFPFVIINVIGFLVFLVLAIMGVARGSKVDCWIFSAFAAIMAFLFFDSYRFLTADISSKDDVTFDIKWAAPSKWIRDNGVVKKDAQGRLRYLNGTLIDDFDSSMIQGSAIGKRNTERFLEENKK